MDISGKRLFIAHQLEKLFASMHAGFRIYVTHMRFRRVERHAQLLGNLLDGAPCHQQRQHLALAIRQPKALGNLRAAVRKSMTSLFVKHLGNVGSIDRGNLLLRSRSTDRLHTSTSTAAAQPRPASSPDPAAARLRTPRNAWGRSSHRGDVAPRERSSHPPPAAPASVCEST